MKTVKIKTQLTARHLVPDRNGVYKEIKADRRVVKNKVVTSAFVNYIVDNLIAEVAAFGDFKFHGSGTGTGNEASGDTALGTEVETRDTGTQVEGDTANIYKSVATHTYGSTLSITEHGLFNASTAGTLMDRTKFTAISVVNLSQIEFTFTIEFTAGG